MRVPLVVSLFLLSYSLAYPLRVNRLSVDRIWLSIGVANGKILLAGGEDGSRVASNRVDIYNVETNSFSTASLNETKRWIAGTSVKDLVLFAGGRNDPTDFRTVEIFNTTSGQKRIGQLSRATMGAAATTVRDIVIIGGGSGSSNLNVDIYNATSNTWRTSSLSTQRQHLTATSNGDYAFFAGGYEGSSTSRVVDIYSTRNASWVPVRQLSAGRAHLASTSVRDSVLFAGGEDVSSTKTNAVDIYNITSQSFTLQSLSIARSRLAAVSYNQLAIFAGGFAQSSVVSVIDIYDSITKIWKTDSLSTGMGGTVGAVSGSFLVFSAGSEVNVFTLATLLSTTPPTSLSTSISSSRVSTISTTSTLSSSSIDKEEMGGKSQLEDSNALKAVVVVPIVVIILLVIVIVIIVAAVIIKRRRNINKETMTEVISRRTDANYREDDGSLVGLYKTLYGLMPTSKSEISSTGEVVIGKQIGKGITGIVFIGDWKGVTVAVKRLNVTELTPQWLEVFSKECNLMRKMEPHPNVLRFYGVIEPLSIVTEYCPNGSLDKLLENKSIRMDMKMRIDLLKSIAAGMNHLAKQNIVHRDLAARNCLLRADMTAVVSDFGMSRSHNQGNQYLASAENNFWPIKWMAPETFSTQRFSEKTDVFSFGVVCVEVLTRQLPYPDYTTAEFSVNVLGKRLVSTLPDYLPESTPEFLITIIKQCTSMDPVVRPTFRTISKLFEDPEYV